jgi:hypothetical protein
MVSMHKTGRNLMNKGEVYTGGNIVFTRTANLDGTKRNINERQDQEVQVQGTGKPESGTGEEPEVHRL